MEPQSGQEADHAAGDQLGSESQAVVPGHRAVCQRVDSTATALDHAALFEAGEISAGNSKRFYVPRTNQRLASFRIRSIPVIYYLSVVLHIYRHNETTSEARRIQVHIAARGYRHGHDLHV